MQFTNHRPVVYFSLLILLLLSSCSMTPVEGQSSNERPTPTLQISNGLPQDLAVSLNPELCINYCWHGIMLGQNKEEALNAIQEDPWTDKSFEFKPGEYIWAESTRITWVVKDIPAPEHPGAGVILKDNLVYQIHVPLTEPFPFQNLIDEIGEPAFVRGTVWQLGRPFSFSVHYPKERLIFGILGLSKGANPPRLRADSMITDVSFFANEQDYRCNKGVWPWDGFGGPYKYYDPRPDPPPFYRETPSDCPLRWWEINS